MKQWCPLPSTSALNSVAADAQLERLEIHGAAHRTRTAARSLPLIAAVAGTRFADQPPAEQAADARHQEWRDPNGFGR